MKIVSKYFCEKCGKEFHWESDCQEHEEHCGVTYKFLCDKCGKTIGYTINDHTFSDFRVNECWVLQTNHHRAGYGSGLDGWL